MCTMYIVVLFTRHAMIYLIRIGNKAIQTPICSVIMSKDLPCGSLGSLILFVQKMLVLIFNNILFIRLENHGSWIADSSLTS